MKRIALIAKNAFRAVMSQRAVYLWGFAILIMFLVSGRALFTNARAPEVLAFIRATSVAAALGVWSLMCLAAAVYLGATSVAGDLRSKTIITVLARPVRRWELMLGKWIGVTAFCFVTLGIGVALGLALAAYVDVNVDRDGLAVAVMRTIGSIVVLGGIATALSASGSAPIAGAVAVLIGVMPMLITPLRERPEPIYQRLGAALDMIIPPDNETLYGGVVWAPVPASPAAAGAPAQRRTPIDAATQRQRTAEAIGYAGIYFAVGCFFFTRRDLKFS